MYLEIQVSWSITSCVPDPEGKALRPAETSVTIYPSAHFSIPEDLDIAVACTDIRSSILRTDMNMK